MEKTTRKVSTHDLFPIIEELLAMDRQAIFTVKGRSMLPFIGDNRDQVVLDKKDFSNLKVGDIILFKNKYNNYILHRIYSISQEGYLTIGDGNLHFDGYVKKDEIIGVVIKIIRKNKEIDCNSKYWKSIFYIWMKLLPLRGTMLKIYSNSSKLKRKILT
ncbi:signal peptidase I [Terrisporobacter mayombei]|uniref:Signal peptidase I n=1 Tax=Terrisporobacter mayombei TaxID=1541 RepID=A0ABY9Q5Z7_9FIRM|nr:signal peptidase I [Terrisporobacter mayombei]MCC3869643.1 signal peptidase I [Terrisporobacter mayombei]WMT83418.1 hypothetical protein TEMA_39340 [Terrisporobacter mayombei]